MEKDDKDAIEEKFRERLKVKFTLQNTRQLEVKEYDMVQSDI